MAAAIHIAEVDGIEDCHFIRGGSGERGCYQYTDGTWIRYSKAVLGYVPPRTKINEKYVTVIRLESYFQQGYNAREIALIWNGGEPVEKSGVNDYGVAYCTGCYAQEVLLALANVTR